jgi:nitrate/nitrite-specific signal transduction histidine kinase
MARDISFRNTLRARLGGIVVVMLATSVALVVGNFWILASLRGEAASMALLGEGRMHCSDLLFHLERLFRTTSLDERRAVAADIRDVQARLKARAQHLLQGSGDRIVAVSDPQIIAGIGRRDEQWQAEIKPPLDELVRTALAGEKGGLARIADRLRQVEKAIRDWQADLGQDVDEYQRVLERKAGRFQLLLYLFSAVVLLVVVLVLWVSWSVSRRARQLAQAAD